MKVLPAGKRLGLSGGGAAACDPHRRDDRFTGTAGPGGQWVSASCSLGCLAAPRGPAGSGSGCGQRWMGDKEQQPGSLPAQV